MPQSSGPTSAFIAPAPEDLNKLFDHLENESLLGQGGMGAVYKAKQISLDRLVAVKILPPYAGSDPSFLERFQREARALAKLTHPNIVMVFEFGQVSEMFYFVMEYVDGVNLREAIDAGGLTTHESLKVIPQICEALQFAHDEGIVHRDIKPENIMLDSKGRIKIADFGLAKLLERNAINFTLTSTNQVLGTVKYMAPEQIENPNAVDHRSDIYSLGVVFYELLTGELPLGRFDPPSATIQTNQPLDPVVMRTLEKQPSNRFQQASEVKSAVESVVISESAVPPQKTFGSDPAPAGQADRSYDATTQFKSKSKRLPAVNFQLQKVFAGFGRGKGLMRVDLENEEIILDIEIKDVLGGMFRSEFKQVRIGFEHILSFTSEFSWYSTPSLEIQTDYFKEFATLPGAENGKVDLHFNSKDKKSALAVCELIQQRLGFDESGRESHEPQPEPAAPVDLDGVKQELAAPTKGIFVSGVIDLVTAAIVLIGSVVAAINLERDAEIPVIAVFGGLGIACLGFLEIYIAKAARNLNCYFAIVVCSLIITLFYAHPGALVAIPCSIWLLIKMSTSRVKRGFTQSEIEQTDYPASRSSIFADAPMQIELRKKLGFPIVLLTLSGFASLLWLAFCGFVLAQNISGPENWEYRMTIFFIVTSAYGLLSLLGAALLRFNPSIFWGRCVSKTCKAPIHLLWPLNFWIGRSIDTRLNQLELENHSGNPYVGKDEGFTNA